MSEAQSKEALQAQMAEYGNKLRQGMSGLHAELKVSGDQPTLEDAMRFADDVEKIRTSNPKLSVNQAIASVVGSGVNQRTGELLNPMTTSKLSDIVTGVHDYRRVKGAVDALTQGVAEASSVTENVLKKEASDPVSALLQNKNINRTDFDTAMRQALAEQGNIAKVIGDTVAKHQNEISEPAALSEEINGAVVRSQHQIQGDVLNAFGKVSQQRGFEGLAGITQAERADFVSAYAKEHKTWLEATAKAAQVAAAEVVSAGATTAETPAAGTPAPNTPAETPAAGAQANTGAASSTPTNNAAADNAKKDGEKKAEGFMAKSKQWFYKDGGKELDKVKVSGAVAAGIGAAYVVSRMMSSDEPEKPETRVMADGRQFQPVQPRAQGAGMSMGAAG